MLLRDQGCANTQSKGSLRLAWDCHICSRKCSQGRGCLRVKVSAKVRTGWRRFQFQDLTLLLLHLIMQCPVAAISLSSIYYYISLLHKKSLIRRQAGKNVPFWITTAVSKEMKGILANPSLCISFFLFSFSCCKHEWNLWVMVITKETTSLKREDTDLQNECGLASGLAQWLPDPHWMMLKTRLQYLFWNL